MEAYRAIKLQQSPNLRQALKDAQRDSRALVGVGVGIASVATTKLVAATGADWAWIDAEHTPMSPTLMADIVQTINMYSEGRMAAVVRVPTHGHEWLAWALDAGAGGVIIPHTETVEQVKASISYARFAPLGQRSYPPFTMLEGITDHAPAGKSWMDVANDHIAIIPQIESMLGVENLEDIMQIEGIDGIMIGRIDLRQDMGLPAERQPGETAYPAALERIRMLAEKYNMPLLGVVAQENIEEEMKGGYRMLCGVSDFHAMGYGIAMSVAASRAVAEETTKVLASSRANEKGASEVL